MVVIPTESAKTKECLCTKSSKARSSRETWAGRQDFGTFDPQRMSSQQGDTTGGPRLQEARTDNLKKSDFALAKKGRLRAGSVSGSLSMIFPLSSGA